MRCIFTLKLLVLYTFFLEIRRYMVCISSFIEVFYHFAAKKKLLEARSRLRTSVIWRIDPIKMS